MWTVLRTTPIGEFRARDALHQIGLDAYVPVEFSISKFGRGREAIRRHPIARGYVFARVPAEAWRHLVPIPEIRGAILVGEAPVRLSQAEIDAVELLSRPLERIRRRGPQWAPGDRAVIRKGAWAQLSAVVSRIERGRVVADVHMFGRTMQVRLSPKNLIAA